MTNKKISVIIPVYNVEKELVRCIKSIINQTYANIEIILVNDGSTDKSLKICEHYSKLDNRIRLITQKNQGLSAARNTGLKFSKGKYVMFVDSDDYVSEYFCEKAYNLISKYDSDIAFFDYNLVLNGYKKHESQPLENGKINKEAALLISFSDSHAWNKIYKAELFEDITYPVGYYYEDTLTTYKLIAKSSKFSYENCATYYYVIRNGSITASGTSTKLVRDSFIADSKRNSYINSNYPKIKKSFNKSLINSSMHYLVLGDNDTKLLDKAKQYLDSESLKNYITVKQKIFIGLYRVAPRLFSRIMKWKYKEKN